MKKSRLFLIATAGIIALTAITATAEFPSISGLFKLNKQLQEEGYYMAEFEFKMLASAYYIDHGNYWTAYKKLYYLEQQLKSREGLIKLPAFKDKNEEMDFYLDRQDPTTGAFMDPTYPYCTYASPTANILNKLDKLSMDTGRPVKLKYPLRFLDEVNSPEKMKRYLDDVSTVGWIGTKFPQNTFHFARCMLSLFFEDPIVEKYNLYPVTPELKTAMIKWFYDRQDPETGLWGPRYSDGTLAKKDTSNSAVIIKAFVDNNGKDLHAEFPLRYRDQLAKSMLDEINPVPSDNDLDEWHEWNLKTSKSLRTPVRYLWNGLSDATKTRVRKMTADYVRTKFEKFYIPGEGAFSYYPDSAHATIEGTGVIGDFSNYGFFSEKKQIRLWGKPEKNWEDLGQLTVDMINKTDFDKTISRIHTNSVRFYAGSKNGSALNEGVLGVFYPSKTPVLDVLDLIPELRKWLNSTSQSMGNWTNKEDLEEILSNVRSDTVPVLTEEFPQDTLNHGLKRFKTITVIGFDELQIPIFRITYVLRN